jgi:hypothetical protein
MIISIIGVSEGDK